VAPTGLQQRLVTTGGRLLKHAPCCWLLLAQSHLTLGMEKIKETAPTEVLGYTLCAAQKSKTGNPGFLV
jgi:hypothetical protein